MDWTLEEKANAIVRPGPLLVIVMDGVGLGRGDEADAVALARTPVLDWLMRNCPWVKLKAHGTAVGLPSDADMGNSEVGHNALGAGRIFDQGAKLVGKSIESGRMFEGRTWKKLIQYCKANDGALHFIGLLSDGNVHSHQDHLHAMIDRAASEGVRRLFVHILLDGRDVPETSALTYVDRLENYLARYDGSEGRTYKIASGGGRMVTTMDRYEADWSIVERGWNAHVHGKARGFGSAREAIETYRSEQEGLIDQFIPPFVIVRNGTPVGPIRDGDSVIFFNFRGDRAIEISKAFESDEFPHFDRGRRPKVEYAGMLEYDGDAHIPKQYLVEPPHIERTLGEYLARNGIRQFACSETQKFGHVTYFWNGNRTGMFDPETEEYLEIPSDQVPFEQRPWMKSAEIADATIERIHKGTFKFGRINFANGDMVGHTGDRNAAIIAVEAVDLALGRVLEAIREEGGVALVTADHGNSDEMYEREKDGSFAIDEATGLPKPRTSHSLNPVPLILYDPIGLAESGWATTTPPPAGTARGLAGHEGSGPEKQPAAPTSGHAGAAGKRWPLVLSSPEGGAGLANVAATCFHLLGFEAPEDYEHSLLASSQVPAVTSR